MLYDLREDPLERENLVESQHHPRLAEFRQATRAWLAGGHVDFPAAEVHLDAETLKRLEALGYVLGPERN